MLGSQEAMVGYIPPGGVSSARGFLPCSHRHAEAIIRRQGWSVSVDVPCLLRFRQTKRQPNCLSRTIVVSGRRDFRIKESQVIREFDTIRKRGVWKRRFGFLSWMSSSDVTAFRDIFFDTSCRACWKAWMSRTRAREVEREMWVREDDIADGHPSR